MEKANVESVKDSLNLHPRIMKALQKCGLHKISSILIYSSNDLCRMLNVSSQDVEILILAASNVVTPSVATVCDLHMREIKLHHRGRLSWGCPVMDSQLAGGVLVPGVTELSGVSAAGKTQLCLQLSLVVQLTNEQGGLNGGAVYISTEDAFPSKRLCQLANVFGQHHSTILTAKQLTDNIFIEHTGTVSALSMLLEYKLPSLLTQQNIKLIIIDSIAALFRAEYVPSQHSARAKLLKTIGSKLSYLSWKYSAAVICVNQVTAAINHSSNDPPHQSSVLPALGLAWADIPNMRVMLHRDESITDGDLQKEVQSSQRCLQVLSAPHLPNITINYNIDSTGVHGLQHTTTATL